MKAPALGLILMLNLSLASPSASAATVGPIYFTAYLLSFNEENAIIRINGRELVIPRLSIPKDAKTQEMTIVEMLTADYLKLRSAGDP